MDEAWIQQSLARLEALETHKAQLEASGQTAGMAEIDAEISALYEVLESAAGDEEQAQQAPAPQPVAQPQAFAPQPQLFAPQPQAVAPAAFEAPSYAPPISPAMNAPAPVMAPDPGGYDPSMSYADAEYDAPKSKAPIFAVAALLVAGLGAGGWYIAGQDTQTAAPAAAPTDPEVISAAAVPDDTQEPEVAKGGDASVTLGTKYKESNRPAPKARRPGNGGGHKSAPRQKRGKKDKSRKVGTIDKSRDPLAGVK